MLCCLLIDLELYVTRGRRGWSILQSKGAYLLMEFRHLQCKAKGSAEAALLDLTKTFFFFC